MGNAIECLVLSVQCLGNFNYIYMQDLILLGTILGIHALAVVSPGPDFVMAVKNSLSYSRRTGVFTAIGFALGLAVHLVYCVLGLAVIIAKSILVFNIIKFLGAGYLIYIGVMSLLSKEGHIKIEMQEKRRDISALKAVKMGFLTNVLNPKATLFFLGLFTLVISPDTSMYVILVAAVLMIINTALWFSLVAVFFTQVKVRNVFERFVGVFNKLFGGILVFLGVKVALMGND